MQYIDIVNWEKYQHYKNRRPPWIKLLTEIIDEFDRQGKPKKFYGLPDTAKLTFVGLLCLRSRYELYIPYPDDKWLKYNIGVKHINLQPLMNAGFITIASNTASNTLAKCYQNPSPELDTERENREQRTDIDTDRDMLIFDKARKLYPGRKRGLATELDNLRKKHTDWQAVLPEIEKAIQQQINWRRSVIDSDPQAFVPEWKNLQTWINQRCWEEELPNDNGRTTQTSSSKQSKANWGHPEDGSDTDWEELKKRTENSV